MDWIFLVKITAAVQDRYTMLFIFSYDLEFIIDMTISVNIFYFLIYKFN